MNLGVTLLDTSGFPPRWQCGAWTPVHGWVHIISDLAIFGAYAMIPVLLTYFILKKKDAPFGLIFWLFGLFILSCGIGHLVESTLFWKPWYRLSGLVKVVTAGVSWLTVIALIPVIPRALALPGLAALNQELEMKNRAHQNAEEELRRAFEEQSRQAEELRAFKTRVVGREQRMIELKREINELQRVLGQPPKYRIVTDAEGNDLGNHRD